MANDKVAIWNQTVKLGRAPANGELLIGNGADFNLAALTAGSNVTITNTAGGISIASTNPGGTATAISPTDPMFGAVGDNSTNDKAAIDAWLAYLIANKVPGVIPALTFLYDGDFDIDLNGVSTAGIQITGITTQSSIFHLTNGHKARIFCSGGTPASPVIQANSVFQNFGFQTNVADSALTLGTNNYADQLNQNEFVITVTNSSTSGSARGVKMNALYSCRGDINTVVNGNPAAIAVGSIGIEIRKMAFGSFKLGAAGTDIGLSLTNDFVYGNVFDSPDLEIVNTAVRIDVATAQTNTFIGGTYGYNTYGVTATAGANNLFINPNINSASPFFQSGANAVGATIIGGGANSQTQLVAPSSGGTVTINELTPALYIAAATSLTSLTVNMPANPADGQTVSITTLYEIQSISLSAGTNSIILWGTTLPAGGSITFKFYSFASTWYPVTGSPLGNLSVPVTKTADFSVAPNEVLLIVDKASACTITLPAASSYPGRTISIRTITNNTVSSASSNVVPLAGGAAGTSILSATTGKWADLVSDATNWLIMRAN